VIRSLAFALAIAAVASSGCRRASPVAAPAEAARAPDGEPRGESSSSPVSEPADAAAATSAKAGGAALGRSCAGQGAEELAPFPLDTSRIDVQPPPIVDPEHVLRPFYERLASLARGTARDHVRIAVYGDSNMTADYITGAMRRALATRFGDAGHGYVALGRPWPWYLHRDVRHDVDLKHWRMFATSTNRTADGYYGFANIAAESSTAGATTWVETADQDAPIGRTCSHFDLFYLKQPHGGSFAAKLDGEDLRVVSTASSSTEAGFEPIDVPDAPHRLAYVARGDGKVRLFGVALERSPAPGRFGAVVDSLGVGALNFEQMQHVESKTRVAMLAHRGYDLVVFLLGTNMFAPELHATWVKNVLVDFRAALPHTPILILSPPDIVLKSADQHSDPRIVHLAAQMKSIAAQEGAAFWDFRAAMGGDASIKTFMRKGLGARDHVHLTQAGGTVMGERLTFALFADLQSYIADTPTLGCASPVGLPGPSPAPSSAASP
jgi:hypothetical protein